MTEHRSNGTSTAVACHHRHFLPLTSAPARANAFPGCARDSESRRPYVTKGEGRQEEKEEEGDTSSRNGTWTLTPGVEEAAGRLGGRTTGGTVVKGHSLLIEGKEARTS